MADSPARAAYERFAAIGRAHGADHPPWDDLCEWERAEQWPRVVSAVVAELPAIAVGPRLPGRVEIHVLPCNHPASCPNGPGPHPSYPACRR